MNLSSIFLIYLSIHTCNVWPSWSQLCRKGGRGNHKFKRTDDGIALWGLYIKPFAASHDMDLAGRGRSEFLKGLG